MIAIEDTLVYELIADDTGRRRALFYSEREAWEWVGTASEHLHRVQPIWLPIVHAVIELDHDGGVRPKHIFSKKEDADATAAKLNLALPDLQIEVEPWWLEAR